MIRRGPALATGSLVLVAVGLVLRWPEATAMGAGGLGLLLVVLLLNARPVRGRVGLDRVSLRVVRGEHAAVSVAVQVRRRRRRSVRLVEGPVAWPRSTRRLPRPRDRDGRTTVPVVLDTGVRGVHPVGPFTLVQGDPWGLVQRVGASAEGGTVMVHPRTVRVRRAIAVDLQVGEAEARSRRSGDQHFHALRDYVLGDEPRNVHWRSSARAGHLVVRQQVTAASLGTTVVLDTDVTAYGADDPFAPDAGPARFEAAVEVAASMAASQVERNEEVHLLTASAGGRVITCASGATAGILDALALVRTEAPAANAPEELVAAVRRTSCARVIMVTGTPSARTTAALLSISRLVPSALVVRVGAVTRERIGGLRLLDVDGVEELV